MKTLEHQTLTRGRLNAGLVSVHHADETQPGAPPKGRRIPLGLTRDGQFAVNCLGWSIRDILAKGK